MVKGPRRKVEAAINAAGANIRDLRWWKHEKPHVAVADNWRRIGKRTSAHRNRDVYYACLYDDADLAAAVQGHSTIGEFTPQTMATNIVRRQIDTYTAKIAKNRPVPMGLTSAGNYSQQRRAKAISTFFEGILDQVGYWPTRTLRIRDAGIFGTGLALNYRVGRKIVHDRIFKREARVCPIDAERGKPRTVYIGRRVDKLLLAERFPEHAEKIFQAAAWIDDGGWKGLEDDLEGTVFVVEAKHLPSGENANDGAHAIVISNETLSVAEYKYDHFLMSKLDYSPAVAGWFGTGIAQQLEGLQYEINSVGLRMQERHYLMGSYVLCEQNADVEYEQIDNGTLTEVRYAGTPPQFVSPPAVSGDLFNWWQTLRTQMPAEITGISGMSSRAEKPAGLNSGKALRVFHDVDTENLTPQGRADEDDVIATCWQFFDLAEEIYAETKAEPSSANDTTDRGPYVVQVEARKRGRSVLEEIDYAKVRLDREQFKLRTFPTNFLRGTPEEQIQSVNEMIEAGFLSQDEALILLDFPDLQRVLNLRTAARHIIERTLERFLDAEDPTAEGVYVYPEPPMGLELCKALAIMTYLEAKLDGAPEGNLKLVMDFYLDANAELEKAKAQPAPPPGAAAGAGAPPPGDPGAMPPGAPPELYAPPTGPLMPAGAVAPEAIAPLPTGAA